MDPTKPGKGILASLEHKTVEPPRRTAIAAPSAGRGAALVVSAGVLIGALLAWWLSCEPSPVIVQEPLSPFVTAPPQPDSVPLAESAAAAIVDEALPPDLPSSPAASPAKVVAATVRQDRVAKVRPQPKPAPKTKQLAVSREKVRHAPRPVADTDVALLSAVMAHANEHDVIEPHPGDGTASLLQRCRRVGGEEGRLCRIRICAGCLGDSACGFEK